MKHKGDYLLSVAGKLSSAVLGLVSSVFYIRYLGIILKGQYSYINEVASILAIVFSFGMHQSYARQTRMGGGNLPGRYGRIWFCQFVLLLAAAGGLSAAVPALGGDRGIWMILLQVPFLVVMTQTESMAMVENVRACIIADMVFKTCLTGLYFALWRFAPVSLAYLILPVQGLRLVKSACLAAVSGVRLRGERPFVDRALLKEILSFGLLPMLSTLLITFNYTLDILFLKEMGTPEELSLYTLAALIINYVWLLPDAFKDVLYSRVARADSETEVRISIKGSVCLVLVCCAGFALAGRWALGIVFGPEYLPAWRIVMILFIGAVSMIYYKMLGVVLITEGRTGIYFAIMLASVLVNAVSNLALIPVWGMTGAAWSSVLSYTLCGILFLYAYCRLKQKHPRDYLLPDPQEGRRILEILRKGRE